MTSRSAKSLPNKNYLTISSGQVSKPSCVYWADENPHLDYWTSMKPASALSSDGILIWRNDKQIVTIIRRYWLRDAVVNPHRANFDMPSRKMTVCPHYILFQTLKTLNNETTKSNHLTKARNLHKINIIMNQTTI